MYLSWNNICVHIWFHRAGRRDFPTLAGLQTCIYPCHVFEIDSCHISEYCIITSLVTYLALCCKLEFLAPEVDADILAPYARKFYLQIYMDHSNMIKMDLVYIIIEINSLPIQANNIQVLHILLSCRRCICKHKLRKIFYL